MDSGMGIGGFPDPHQEAWCCADGVHGDLGLPAWPEYEGLGLPAWPELTWKAVLGA